MAIMDESMEDPPKAHKRKREPFRRKRPGSYANIDNRLNSEPKSHTLRQQAREKALQLDRLPTDFECAANEPVKNKEDENNNRPVRFPPPLQP